MFAMPNVWNARAMRWSKQRSRSNPRSRRMGWRTQEVANMRGSGRHTTGRYLGRAFHFWQSFWQSLAIHIDMAIMAGIVSNVEKSNS